MYKRLLNISQDSSFSAFLLGPRGTGKTSWVRSHFPDALYIDLLHVETYKKLLSNPSRLSEMIPATHKTWVIIDEIQKVPELLNEVHRLIEHKSLQFILTGSSARKLKRSGVNLLAGRALQYFMHPLTINELGSDFSLQHALRYGLLPAVIHAEDPAHFLESYIATYLREEVLQEGLVRNIGDFARFLEVASFSQGSALNLSAIAREASISRKIVETYFNIAQDLLIATQLPVFTKRSKRRLASHPKFYYFDVGVYRYLRPKGPLDSMEELDGAGLETLFLQHLYALNDYYRLGYKFYYWKTQNNIEVDFIAYNEKNLIAIEVKRKTNINLSDLSGLKTFKKDYPIAQCYVFHGGKQTEYHDDIQVIPIETALHSLLDLLMS